VTADGPVAGNGHCADGSELDAAAWVLDALEPDDAVRFARHLPACRPCQHTVAELEPAGLLLLSASAATQPPLRLAVAAIAGVRKAAGRHAD